MALSWDMTNGIWMRMRIVAEGTAAHLAHKKPTNGRDEQQIHNIMLLLLLGHLHMHIQLQFQT
jgi:hypothetical protein